MARTTALKSPHGESLYARSVTPGYQPVKVYTCNTCHQTVAWVESRKSGKVYLANVYPKRSEGYGWVPDSHRLYPFDLHKCSTNAHETQ